MTTRVPWRVMALSDCQEELGLRADNFKSDPAHPPHFVDTTHPRVPFRDPVAVIVEVEAVEAAAHGWRAGFYILDLSPKGAEKRLPL